MTELDQMIYQDALFRAAAGASLYPFEQKRLSKSPLPETMLAPFIQQDTSLTDALKITADALTAWSAEAKKTSYFSKHFTDLSKMIMQGVTVIGRGLATLHANGEDLELSPMSIQDLIMIASYHLRKSYLGVLQTVKSHPEISTRLLTNQLSWANMLFRLYKTKENLEKPVKHPVIQSDEKKNPALTGNNESNLSGLEPLSDGGAFSAIHGFTKISKEKASAKALALKEKAQGEVELSESSNMEESLPGSNIEDAQNNHEESSGITENESVDQDSFSEPTKIEMDPADFFYESKKMIPEFSEIAYRSKIDLGIYSRLMKRRAARGP